MDEMKKRENQHWSTTWGKKEVEGNNESHISERDSYAILGSRNGQLGHPLV